MSKALERIDPAPAQSGMLQAVLQAMRDPAIDPERLEKFLAIGRTLEADQARRDYIAAFMGAKDALRDIKINKRGRIVYEPKGGKPGGVVKFMKYEDIAAAVKPVLAKHGLAAAYTCEYTQNPPKVITVMKLIHHSGHFEEFRSVPLPMVDSSGGKNDVQGAGSVSSYGRRYVVCPAFDIVAEDEDDNASGHAAPVAVSQDQIDRITDVIQECQNRESGFEGRFLKWLQSEFEIDAVARLYQGYQYDAVMTKLREKCKALGVKW